MSSNGLLFATPTSDLLAVDDRLLGHMELRIRVPCGGTADRAGAGRAGHVNALRHRLRRHGLEDEGTGRLLLAHVAHGQRYDERHDDGGTYASNAHRYGQHQL